MAVASWAQAAAAGAGTVRERRGGGLRTAGAGRAGKSEGMWFCCGRKGRASGAGVGSGKWANWRGMAWTPVARRAEVGPSSECVGERRGERGLRGKPRSIG